MNINEPSTSQPAGQSRRGHFVSSRMDFVVKICSSKRLANEVCWHAGAVRARLIFINWCYY